MRVRVGYLALLVLTVALAGCSAGGSAAAGHAATASPSATALAAASASASATEEAASKALMNALLPVPSDARALPMDTFAPLGRVAFVQAIYAQSSWTAEEAQYQRRGFVTGAFEEWQNGDGSQQTIAVARFATATGAAGASDDLTDSFSQKPKPVSTLDDPAVNGFGFVNPTLDNYGNAMVELVACTGDYVIQVVELTAAAPDPGAAEALLLKQYDAVKSSR
jgi:hypothetical protein